MEILYRIKNKNTAEDFNLYLNTLIKAAQKIFIAVCSGFYLNIFKLKLPDKTGL